MTRFTAALLLAFGTSASQGTCINTSGTCAAGCFNEDGHVTTSGLRVCSPVGPGYYSPAISNERFQCPRGTASSDPEASGCMQCPPGSFGPFPRLVECILCFPSFYQDEPGKDFCFFCTQGYSGEGAAAVTEDGFCLLEQPSEVPSSQPTMPPSSAPSTSPSLEPSKTPTDRPSLTPSVAPSAALDVSPSQAPLSQPTAAPSTTRSSLPSLEPSVEPSLFPSEQPSVNVTTEVDQALGTDEDVCGENSFVLHGQCAQCPSLLRSAILAVVMVVCTLVLATYFVLAAPFGTAVLLIGVDFFQVLSQVGNTHAPWPKLMDVVFAFAAIIGLDIDIIFPLQCHFGLTPQQRHLIVLILPFLLTALSIGGVNTWHAIKDTDARSGRKSVLRLTVLGLVFGFMKLVLTSIEAVSCSSVQGLQGESDVIIDLSIDWVCFADGSGADKTIAVFGMGTFLLYGVGIPAALFVMLRHYRDHARVESETTHLLAEVSRVFLLTHSDYRWWWPIFVLGRKLVFVLVTTFFPDVITLGLILIAFVALLSAAMLWNESPYYEDSAEEAEGDSETARSFSLFRHQTVDLVLQGSIVAIALLGILFTYVPIKSDGRVGLAGFGIVVMFTSIGLLLIAARHASKKRYEAEGTGNKEDETVQDVQRRIEHEGEVSYQAASDGVDGYV